MTSTPVGPLLLQAFGGPAGQVVAQVPLLEAGVGQEMTCGSPRIAGACQLTACLLGGIGDPDPGAEDFGPISATVGTTTVPIPYAQVGYPTVDFPSSVALGTGGTMKFQGGGSNGVPKFDITATVPGLGVITAPVPSTSGGATTIDTSQDLVVTWTPISIGQINFFLDGGSADIGGTSVTVTCTFDGAAGSGVVSQALLSSLKQISGANAVYGNLSSELDASTVVDGLEIQTQSYQTSPSTYRDFDVSLQ